MADTDIKGTSVGWIGTGRMGFAMAKRMLEAGVELSVWNRTKDKAQPLAEFGATIVDSPRDLAGFDIVFTITSNDAVFTEVTTGEGGLLAEGGPNPAIMVDFTTISEAASKNVREIAKARGTIMVDAPVSGNDRAVEAGALSIIASGDKSAFDTVEPYLAAISRSVSYGGEGEKARLVKICHNVYLGIVAQALAEVTVLAEKGGVSRHAFLGFLNNSVMGSTFSAYKTPAYVNLDFTPTFTPVLLRKDMDLGLGAARELGVSMPVASAARECVQTLIGHGYTDVDFAALIEQAAKNAGYEIKSEEVEVGTGL
ncbi:MAG: NAD(P)-dependent oxidoreductase [Rhodospirillales bacterium]|nr:NAD(P)-dependent oxidoreductase [Rhodospirillales bacterium]